MSSLVKLWPGTFEVTNCIVNGGNGGLVGIPRAVARLL